LLPYLENKKVDVYWADHRLAALWANSEAAKAEFPDYTYLVRLWHCFPGGGGWRMRVEREVLSPSR
jgi:hypothetical protein